jgi:hypothetical protein
MNFIEQLKLSLTNPRNRHGQNTQCLVSIRALDKLISEYESLDSMARVHYDGYETLPLQEKLADVLTALYKNNDQNGDRILLTIMDIMMPLIEEKNKAKDREDYINDYKMPSRKEFKLQYDQRCTFS